MKNSFEEFFGSHNPRNAEIEAQRAKLAQQKEAQDLAKRCEQNTKLEIQKYDQLVSGVLEELQNAAYPAARLAKGSWNSWNVYSCPEEMFPTLQYWQTGGEETEMISGKYVASYRKVWKRNISVGLVTDAEGIATAFQCTKDRVQQCELNRESLVRTLLELHSPLPKNIELELHLSDMHVVLHRIMSSQRYIDAFSGRTLFETEEGRSDHLGRLPRIDRDGSIFRVSVKERFYDPDGSYSSERIVVSLIVDDQHTPLHYNCTLLGEKATAALNQESLLSTLELLLQQHLDRLESVRKEEARKKTLMYKLSSLVRGNKS